MMNVSFYSVTYIRYFCKTYYSFRHTKPPRKCTDFENGWTTDNDL